MFELNKSELIIRHDGEFTEEIEKQFSVSLDKCSTHGDPTKNYKRCPVLLTFTGKCLVSDGPKKRTKKEVYLKDKEITSITIYSNGGSLSWDSNNKKAKMRANQNSLANELFHYLDTIVGELYTTKDIGDINKPMTEDDDGKKIVQYRNSCSDGEFTDAKDNVITYTKGITGKLWINDKNNSIIGYPLYGEDNRRLFSDEPLTEEKFKSYLANDYRTIKGVNTHMNGKNITKVYSKTGRQSVYNFDSIPPSKRFELVDSGFWEKCCEEYSVNIVTFGIGNVVFKNSKHYQEHPASWSRPVYSAFLKERDNETAAERIQREALEEAAEATITEEVQEVEV